jgi:hypothetical protein
MDSVIHFEMPADDRKRISDFYSNVFGWKTEQLGEDMGNYVLVTTADTDDKGMIKQPGKINGGFFQMSEEMPEQNVTSIVIEVSDIKKSIELIENFGGKILGEIMEIPKVGRFISFLDTEGNKVGIIQNFPSKQ